MAAEWRIEEHEKAMARKVCARTYETLDDFIEEVRETWGDEGYDSLTALDYLKRYLIAALPFDPEVPV